MSQAPRFPSSVWDGKNPNRENLDVNAAPDAQDYDQIVAEIVAMQRPASGLPAGTGVTASDIDRQVVKTTLTFTNLSVTMTDAGAAGNEGNQKIFDFPEGHILILGAVGLLTLTAGVGGITDTAAVVASIGTVAAAADATLTGTEADIVPSTAATLTGGVGSADMANTATLLKDGTATAVDAFLNIAVPDAGSTASDTMTVNGTLTITWLHLGDN